MRCPGCGRRAMSFPGYAFSLAKNKTCTECGARLRLRSFWFYRVPIAVVVGASVYALANLGFWVWGLFLLVLVILDYLVWSYATFELV